MLLSLTILRKKMTGREMQDGGVMASEVVEMSGDQLKSIAVSAAFLWERAGQAIPPVCPGPLQEETESKLKKWLEVTAEGDRELFEKRLSYDGLHLNTAGSLLESVKVLPGMEAPLWTAVLNEVLRKMPGFRPLGPRPDLLEKCAFLDKDEPIPFEELLLPFIDVARDRIVAATMGKYRFLADKARAGLERSLLQRLSFLSARVLLVEFRTFLACRQMFGQSRLHSPGSYDSRENYLRFVNATYEESWAPLFEEYCVLSRLMATVLILWVEATDEFLQRFEKDLPELRTVFLGQGDPGIIANVKTGLSDPHDGGRTVLLIEFRSGAKVVYKPKSLDLDIHYFRLVDWLNGLEQTLSLRCLKIVSRNGYGWVEFVDNSVCREEEDVRRFYRRSGLFLCLVYALNGVDFHYENIVACGEHPVPVDLETIYHHATHSPVEDTDLTDAVSELLRDSVLGTHLLHNPVKFLGRYIDISGLTYSAEDEFELLTWKKVNTDSMDYSYEIVKSQFSDNLPRFNEKYVSPYDCVEEIVDGFGQMYRLLVEHKGILLAEGSPLHHVFRQEARFVFRATAFYMSVLKNASHPAYLRDGVDHSIQLEILTRYFLMSRWNGKPELWPLVREELEALWRSDIPKFAAFGDQSSLTKQSGEIIPDCFPVSAWDRVQKKIRNLGEKDLEWQISLIKGSLNARYAKRHGSYQSLERHADGPNAIPLLTREELLAGAVAVAGEIQGAAVYAEKGEPSWLVLEHLPGVEQFRLNAVNYDLYSGRSGIALFFAALERALPGLGYRDTAYSTLTPARRWLGRAEAREIESLGIGGVLGLPSIAYTLARVGTFFNDADLLEEAKCAVLRIGKEQIDSDSVLDVIGGSAGTILCLTACHKAIGAGEILDKAVACGRHLLAKREVNESGLRAWPTMGKRHLTGFSHGAAGIAYALLKLYRETGDREFYNAAQEGINFENHEFVPEKNNWPDHRELNQKGSKETGPNFSVSWCHGAPGIGLARLGALDVMDSQSIRNDIRCALITTEQCGELTQDHICCGNAGLAETLLVAGGKLHDPGWTQKALRIMSNIAVRIKGGSIGGDTFRNGFCHPSLFQGAAGVGYQFLRLSCPEKIPSVLLLE